MSEIILKRRRKLQNLLNILDIFNKNKVHILVSGSTVLSGYNFSVLNLDYNIFFDDECEKIKFDLNLSDDLSLKDENFYVSIIEGDLINVRLLCKNGISFFSSKNDFFSDYESDNLINFEGFGDSEINGILFSFDDGTLLEISLLI